MSALVFTVVFNNPLGPQVVQYQTVQGAYGILDREYCVLQQKLYGLQGGYYGVNKNGEVVYDMPYDAVINTSLPVPQEDAVGAAVRIRARNFFLSSFFFLRVGEPSFHLSVTKSEAVEQ